MSPNKRMNEYDDPLLYVFENWNNKEKVKERSYELYPEFKMVHITK